MNTAVTITAMICITVIIISWIGSGNRVTQSTKTGDNIIDGSRDRKK